MNRPRNRSAHRRGSALIVVLITVVGVLALLGILFPLSQSGLRAQRQSRQQFELNLLLRAAIEEALDEIRTGNDPDGDGTGAVGLAYAVGEAGGDGFNLPDPLEAQLGVGVDGVGPDADDLAQLGKPLVVAIDRDGDGNDGNSPGEVVRTVGRYLAFVDRPAPDARTLKVVVAIPDFLRPDALAGAEVRLAVPQGGARHALSITGATGTPSGNVRIQPGQRARVTIADPTLTVPALNVDDPTTYGDAKLTNFISNAQLVQGKSVNGGVPVPNLDGDTYENHGATLFSVNQAEIDRAAADVLQWVADLKAGAASTTYLPGDSSPDRFHTASHTGPSYTTLGGSYDPDDPTNTDLVVLGSSTTSDTYFHFGEGDPGNGIADGISFLGTGVLLIENGNSVEFDKGADFYWNGDVVWRAKPSQEDTLYIRGADLKIDGNLIIVVDEPPAANRRVKLHVHDDSDGPARLEVNGTLAIIAPGFNDMELDVNGAGPGANQPDLIVNGLLLVLSDRLNVRVKGKNHTERATFQVTGGMVLAHGTDWTRDLERLDFQQDLDAQILYDQARYDAALQGLLKRTPGLIGWSSQGYLERPGVTLLGEALTALLTAQTDTTAYSND